MDTGHYTLVQTQEWTLMIGLGGNGTLGNNGVSTLVVRNVPLWWGMLIWGVWGRGCTGNLLTFLLIVL